MSACGETARHSDDTTESPSPAESPDRPDPARKASFGYVAIEAIEDDGSRKGLGVEPNLVEHMNEVRDALPMLAEAQVSLAFMLQAHKLKSSTKMDEIFALVEDAEKRGIEVVPVPVISADDGYYPNATNHAQFIPAVRELVAQWKARGLTPTTLFVDMEPPRDLVAALTSLKLTEAVPSDHIDRARFAAGVDAYTALVDELHDAGWRVGVTTQGMLLADYDDGDDDLRQYFSVVLDGPAWDQVDFQLYRSAYTSQVPGLDAHFVYEFARKAVARFPDAEVGAGLGLTHPGPIYPETPTHESSKSLREDVQAALAAGLSRELITVYNLKGILKGPPKCEQLLGCKPSEYTYGANDPSSWLVTAETPVTPQESLATGALEQQFGLMDQLLNVSEDSQADGLL